MKRNYLSPIVSIIIGVVTLTAILVSCKKDKLTEPPKDIDEKKENFYDVKTNLIVERIKRFDNQLKELKKGVYRDEMYIDADSALWNIESLFNVTYSSPDENYVDKKIHELSFEINVDNDKLSMKDVNDLYDDLTNSVREAYRNDGFSTNKGLMSLFVEKGESRSGKLCVKAVAVTGRTDYHQVEYKPFLQGPFDNESCWYYGEYGGSCTNPDILTDAAELIEDTINYYHGYKPDKITNCRSVYVDMIYIPLDGDEYWSESNNDYYIFYKEDCDLEELYLDGNQLNEYYHNEIKVIKELIPKDPKYSSLFSDDFVFMEINIDGSKMYGINNIPIYNHQNYVFYGTNCMVTKEDFGNAKDLLNN
ncbi:MAG: hypothetical protein J6R32_10760 [Bacteroidales bacterium]|nr:hypothetical protein [Bacteroidales bacterium]